MQPTRLLRIIPPLRAATSAAPASAAPASHFFSSSSDTGASSPVLVLGDVLRESRRFSAEDVAAYSEMTGDRNPVHFDDDFARSVAGFDGGRVVHGMLVASLFPSIIAFNFPGAIYCSQSLHFRLPVYINDELIAEVEAINLREIKNRYMVKFTTRCITFDDHVVLHGEATAILPSLTLK